MTKPDSAIIHLAKCFDKPIEYVEKAIAFHGVSLPLPRFRTPDDGLGAFYSDMTAFYSTEPSMTKQEFTAECDINVIMKRFIASDFDPSVIPMTRAKPMYGDFSKLPESYHAALNYVIDTENMFLTLSADIRSRFDNDPQKFLDFYDDPKNYEELVKMGLVQRKPDLSPSPPIPSRAEGIGEKSEPPAKEASSSSSTAKKGGKAGE